MKMNRKRYVLIYLLVVIAFLFVILANVNFNTFEFKLSIKALLMQELSVEEIKNSKTYKAYSIINRDTKSDEIDSSLNKNGKDIVKYIRTWYYPYGYVSIFHSGDKPQIILNKIVRFKTPHTNKLTEEKLYSLFAYKSVDKLVEILGEPIGFTETFRRNGETEEYSYSWGIKTRFSQKYVNDTITNHTKPISLPNDIKKGKFRLGVTVDKNNNIIKFALYDY